MAARKPARISSDEEPFEPARYLTRVNGADYLEVKWRLVWLRDKHPDATIETELVSHQNNTAVFKAKITIPEGGSATGYGSESAGDFIDYLEKAETKAIGRALGALGFGTQFAPDFEFGATEGRVVDAPVKTPTRTPARGATAKVPSNGSSDSAKVNVAPANREELLAEIVREQSRIGSDTILAWAKENTTYVNPKRSDFTDDELQALLTWAREQPTLDTAAASA